MAASKPKGLLKLHGPWIAFDLADHPGQACTILQEKGLAAGTCCHP